MTKCKKKEKGNMQYGLVQLWNLKDCNLITYIHFVFQSEVWHNVHF